MNPSRMNLLALPCPQVKKKAAKSKKMRTFAPDNNFPNEIEKAAFTT